MNNDELKAAIAVCEKEITAMTRETIRRNYGLKMRANAEIIMAMVELKKYYESLMVKPTVKKTGGE